MLANHSGIAALVLDTLTTGDRVNLLELYARSVMLLELGRCKEWAELFGPHAWIRYAAGSGRAAMREFRGRAELFEFARGMLAGDFELATSRLTPPLRFRRCLTDVTLSAHGPGAAARAIGYAHLTVVIVGTDAPARPVATGTFCDQLHRCTAGCWLFESRTLILDTLATESLPKTFSSPV